MMVLFGKLPGLIPSLAASSLLAHTTVASSYGRNRTVLGQRSRNILFTPPQVRYFVTLMAVSTSD